ncbi:hypothetical protein Q7M_1293 (plasmid) [Borrelia crocidurae str. Achema]|uniref:Lipoprotein n=1 Tax=Borrelia crocidurae (strain Achema) TaxID=1155096 RepID=I0FEZ3_BORCA|nr:hypothetical protein Q7M_1293 [Borrelia crocidurae str. Achema]
MSFPIRKLTLTVKEIYIYVNIMCTLLSCNREGGVMFVNDVLLIDVYFLIKNIRFIVKIVWIINI